MWFKAIQVFLVFQAATLGFQPDYEEKYTIHFEESQGAHIANLLLLCRESMG
jgi:hypothetical protein